LEALKTTVRERLVILKAVAGLLPRSTGSGDSAAVEAASLAASQAGLTVAALLKAKDAGSATIANPKSAHQPPTTQGITDTGAGKSNAALEAAALVASQAGLTVAALLLAKNGGSATIVNPTTTTKSASQPPATQGITDTHTGKSNGTDNLKLVENANTKKKPPKRKSVNAARSLEEEIKASEKLLNWKPSASVMRRATISIERLSPVLRNSLIQYDMAHGAERTGLDFRTDPNELHLIDNVLLASTDALRDCSDDEIKQFMQGVQLLRKRAHEELLDRIPEVRCQC
jgi:hypothetical protein